MNTTTENKPATEPAPTPETPHNGNGFVARLPNNLRHQLNQMILDGVPYAQIIKNLGEPGSHLNEDHISSWKKWGGYAKWLLDQRRAEAIRASHETATAILQGKSASDIQDAGRTIAAAQINDFLLNLNPQTFSAAMADKPELYTRLISTLARLSENESICATRRARLSVINASLQPDSQPGAKSVTPETLQEIIRLIKLI